MAINPANITTVRVGQLPTANPELTNNIAIEQGTDLYRCTLQELVDLLAISAGALQFEVKTLNVNQTYVNTNFDSTGLGRNLCLGFAICNGQNGTPNLDGLVSLGYGTNYNTIGGFGGSATHQLIESEVPTHSHTINGSANDNGDAGNFAIGSFNSGGVNFTIPSSTFGGGQPHNNMQPYIVQLKIMKL